MRQAQKLQECGAFAVVFEAIPAALATAVTSELLIPTIGIGAGSGCSGQVLVMQDLLGMNVDFQPKFVRRYLNGFQVLQEAFNQFDSDVKSGAFPSEKESYS